MTRIYIVRHCEAMGNVLRIFQGTTDLDISELGGIQLKYLEKYFENIAIDDVISSPLIRAKKTGMAIIGKKSIELKIDNGLAELHGGIVEGQPFAETFRSIPGLADTWDNHPEDFAPSAGEKMSDAYERIWHTVLKIAEKNKDKTVACATHGGVSRCLNCRLLYNDIHRLKDTPWSENTGITLIEFDDDLKPKLVFYNKVDHLPEEYLNKKTRLSAFMKGDGK